MGVKKLADLLKKYAPNSIKKKQINQFKGQTFACDAPIIMYQFLTMINNYSGNMSKNLTDKNNIPTGHLLGFMSRSLQMLDNQIQPFFVFDGKPPQEKFEELERRETHKKDSLLQLEKIQKEYKTTIPELQLQKQKLNQLKNLQTDGLSIEQILLKNKIDIQLKELVSLQSRTIFISDQMREDGIIMLDLLGIPYLIGPGEAEAQCSDLVKQGKCYATVTEDMDSILFKSTKVLRNFNSKVQKEGLIEYDYNQIIIDLEITENQFLDLCILMGTDFCETIKNIGPIKALKFIKQYGNIEGIIDNLDILNEKQNKLKYQLPQIFKYQQARDIFQNPLVYDTTDFKIEQKPIKEKELLEFLVNEKNFSKIRVEAYIQKMQKIIEMNN